MRKTDMEQWAEIAQAVKELQEARSNLLEELTHDGNVPKTVYNTQFDRVGDGASKLKSDLEDRMFKEHPDEATTDVFYGGDGDSK
jgi:phage-related minor tail protein